MAVTPFSTLPLDTGVYLSRVSEFMSRPANYVLAGFRPGFALQAAELNEMQEQFLFYQTLSNRTNNNWRDVYTAGNPFWDGCTPYTPTLLTVTIPTSGTLTVSAARGWYYIVDTISTPTAGVLNSGFGYWIYLETQQTINVTFAETSTTPLKYGFTYSISDVNSSVDDTLNDESNAANANMTVPGANRIKLQSIQLTKTNSGLSKFSTLFTAIRTTQSQFTLNWPYNTNAQVFATGTN